MIKFKQEVKEQHYDKEGKPSLTVCKSKYGIYIDFTFFTQKTSKEVKR